MNVDVIAHVCHESNAALCAATGDMSQPGWSVAPEWQRQSAVKGVGFAIANPDATPESQHVEWCKDKIADGWKLGLVKDAESKTHPCLVPYSELPDVQRRKDALFRVIVAALKD